ncbi:piggyBac transposable element-derived protein 3-like [Ixodes scapularis]|uniref:piggyBac transposable element-derived protein 3-like n=1 Tax=Ixodes scapularis TaxID=6945 RepID=UPI001C38D1A3|nr:piggyBac transposable element-derived protein 3-like [Ixodes scapularis]
MDSRKFYGKGPPGNGNESEDSELSDDGDDLYVPPEKETVPLHDLSSSDTESVDDAELLPSPRIKKQKTNIPTWKEKTSVYDPEAVKFSGDTTLPREVTELDTPLQYFKYFITPEIVDHIVDQTNLYSVQCEPNKPVCVTGAELEQFFGTILYMSIVKLPATRLYWNSHIGQHAISGILSCNRWEELKRFLHVNDNTTFAPIGHPSHDKLHKIRPLLDMLNARLHLIPKEEYLAVVEQIIPTKSRSSIKQYNAKKPHKWGYKAFVLSGISGFSYEIEVFAGAQNNTVPVGCPDLGASSNV